MKILLIQSDTDYLNVLHQTLAERQYTLELASDGYTGLAMGLHARFDLIVLDTHLTRMNGLDVIRRLRQENDSTPVLLLSRFGESADKAKGLYAGADDYLVRPCDSDELLARIYALHRRRIGGFNAPSVLTVDNLELNVAEKVAYRANQRIKLTAREFQLLEFLIKNAGRVVTKSQILEKVWDNATVNSTNKVEVYINFLRKKIDRDFDHKLIHTAMGVGYLLRSGS
ncbi:response regulator transcription factor [Spirosoma fluviale]|uniref:DNA-binding response regulator, OmpR family, contains REC and winged-helix (WHTH) domain n=1 Tax=Spirosoma fluviale TaxID=1597977 RepID=A0A286FB91_9BACT|nr:response regulator transcription factor [Spirosoma fluviale]SOD80114.1 DNA-binding response regulator, OmpR family, contains REC and winged-helix (wHTH) domain [Spirosoma fluviale]